MNNHNARKAVNAKDHPLSRDMAQLLSAHVAYLRRVVAFQGNDRFKRQLFVRIIGGLAHVQSLAAMLAQGEGVTEDEISKALTVGEQLLDEAVTMAQNLRQDRMGVVHARPRTGQAAEAGAPAPLVDLSFRKDGE